MKKIKITTGIPALLLFIFVTIVSLGAKWIITCGIIKLITMCFGLTFKWSIATGIWLVLQLLSDKPTIEIKTKRKE